MVTETHEVRPACLKRSSAEILEEETTCSEGELLDMKRGNGEGRRCDSVNTSIDSEER